MAFKLNVFLAILKLVSSAAEADPDPDIIVDFKLVVKGGGCCPGDCCPEPVDDTYCKFNGEPYQIGTMVQGTCEQLQCIEGADKTGPVWNYTGYIDTKCGTCEVAGDPHITPYQYHELTGNVPLGWPQYMDTKDGRMVLSQHGLNKHANFGVDAEFEACPTADGGNEVTCVSKVFYREPGIKVELILPEKLDNFPWCFNDPSNWDKPECSTTKIKVDGSNQIIVDGAPARSFYADGGTVLIFTKKCDIPTAYCKHIYVVGSKGYSVFLHVDPSWSWLYNLTIYATPNLHNEIFGLCDVFTGSNHLLNGFTNQDGTLTTNYDKLNITFTPSWKNDCNGIPNWCTAPWRWVPSLCQCFQFVDMTVGPGSPGVAWGVASSLCISMYPPYTQLAQLAMPYESNMQDLSKYMKSNSIRAGLPEEQWWIRESNTTGCDVLTWDVFGAPIITHPACNTPLSYICEKSIKN